MGECLTGGREMNWSLVKESELDKPLQASNVKRREGKYDYVEAWHAIAEANRIFGFGNWSRETIYCRETCRIERPNGKGWTVGYEAKVRITVGDVVREGTGAGSGVQSDLFGCIEKAAKEAESDAMKRALMTFGYPFGLALYDKEKANVADTPEPAPEPLPKALQEGVALYQKMKGDKENAQFILDENAGALVELETLSKAGDERASKTMEAIYKLTEK
jgi:hypothetical protein